MPRMNQVKSELIKKGCYLHHEGNTHEFWINPKTGQIFRLSRHNKEIGKWLLRQIEKQSGVKLFEK